MSDRKQILDHQEIIQKLKRISYQILEANIDEKSIVVAGIYENGYHIAEIIVGFLKEISSLEISLCKISIDKNNPIKTVSLNLKENDYQNKSVVVVDDVLSTGSTLIYSVNYFLSTPLKQLKTVVLVDRAHKKYPIHADYKGLALSTSMKSHVEVSRDEKGQFSASLVS
ncbi:MAG: phosphoribosyltransferase [Psychroflexus sp.]|nr:phosphoribosyltransferase [Psychroflexus sp.]MDN6310408.1 phosphoribosyltransferase [Psychroflexus sp.]